ncbi:M48 family metallopeptidase [Blautia sp. RD014234]|nr:M48 family metallopeptidase [Blautia parvula]
MEYQIIYGSRTTVGIQITPEGNVVVRAPKHYPKRKIKQFVRMKKEWIHKKAEAGKTDAWYINAQPYQKEEKAQYLDSALEIFAVKADYYASLMGVSYEQIQVMEKYGQWGKCTKDGRLFFNWRLDPCTGGGAGLCGHPHTGPCEKLSFSDHQTGGTAHAGFSGMETVAERAFHFVMEP